ncbi:MAG TPA: hypothetical protein VF292_04780 [Rhodanobacteraceae bacterium]
MTLDQSNPNDRDVVANDEAFARVTRSFIDAAVANVAARKDAPSFAERYRQTLEARVRANCAVVDAFQSASIEKILLRWLLLGSIKWDPLGIAFDASEGIPANVIGVSQRLCAPSQAAADVADQKMLDAVRDRQDGAPDVALCASERQLRRNHFDSGHDVHLALQPPAAPVELDGRPLRADLYFWNPSDDHFAVIAECAGFQPHVTPRASVVPTLVTPPDGCCAVRLAGIDVFRDPVGTVLQLLGALDHEVLRSRQAHPAVCR